MDQTTINSMQIGVVGLGLMGSSIVVSLLAAGHRVVALAPITGERDSAASHIGDLLRHADTAGVLPKGIRPCIDALQLVEDYQELAVCRIVLECVVEDKAIKKAVYHQIAAVVAEDAIIASNTSAIPISELQVLVPHPERFLGIHWAEPAYMTRFLEVTCGAQTTPAIGEFVVVLGEVWGKEPTLLKKDIRGFITNRLMYAVYREALTLIEDGHTTLADADRVFRYDVGSWVTMMGLFERIQSTQPRDHLNAFSRLFGQLSNRGDVPEIMERIVQQRGRGVHNQIGLYTYDASSAKVWESAFAQFNQDIHKLAARYREQCLREANAENIC